MPGPTPRRLIPALLWTQDLHQGHYRHLQAAPFLPSNTLKEEHLLQVADSFSRQYSRTCAQDRVPLFLHPLNRYTRSACKTGW